MVGANVAEKPPQQHVRVETRTDPPRSVAVRGGLQAEFGEFRQALVAALAVEQEGRPEGLPHGAVAVASDLLRLRALIRRRDGRGRRVPALGGFPGAWQLGEMVIWSRVTEARQRQGREPGLRFARGRRLRRSAKLLGKRQLKLADQLELKLWTVRRDGLKEDCLSFRNGSSPQQADCVLPCRPGLTMCSRRAPRPREGHALSQQRPARPNGCRLGRAHPWAVRGVDRQSETGPWKSVRGQVLRIRRNRLEASPRRSTGTRPHVLLKVAVEFYGRQP